MTKNEKKLANILDKIAHMTIFSHICNDSITFLNFELNKSSEA